MYIWHGRSWAGDSNAGEPECISESAGSGIEVKVESDSDPEKGQAASYRFTPFAKEGDSEASASHISVEELHVMFTEVMHSTDPSFVAKNEHKKDTK